MRSVNERIADEIRRHAISLARYSEHEKQSIFRMLNRLFGQLRNDLQDSDITTGRTRYQRRRLELLFKQVRATIATSYDEIGKRTEAGLKSLAEIEGEWAVSMLNKSLGVKFVTMTPATAEQLGAIASDVLIEGAPSSEWWSRQSEKLLNNFKDQIRQGWTRGETLDQLMKRLTGGLDEDGNPYFDLRKGTRRGAEATIRTSVQAVANDARMRVYKDNADIIDGLQWVSTLDLRTTVECAAMDGLVWDLNGNPIGHGMTLDPPPRHWNCRSVLVPITKSFREMGIPIDEFPESTRASMDGQVPESQNFEKWIAGKPDSYADEVFGKGRAELWRQGKISVRDMVDQRGNPLTLEQLRKEVDAPGIQRPLGSLDDPWGRLISKKEYVNLSERVFANLTLDEKDAIGEYTDNWFNHVNGSLRGVDRRGNPYVPRNSLVAEKTPEYISKINAAMSKAGGSPEDLRLFRGMKDTNRVFPNGLKVGDVFSDKGFVSASSDLDTAFGYSRHPGGGMLFEIEVKRGTQLLPLKNSAESEFLLKPGQSFRVIGSRMDVITLRGGGKLPCEIIRVIAE